MDVESVKPKRSQETERLWSTTQISLRFFAFATSFTSAMIIFKNKQVTFLFGMEFSATYTDDPTFKFFAYSNMIAACLSALSLIFSIANSRKPMDQTVYFYFFMHDLIMAMLMTAASAAASAIGYVGKHGNSQAGWIAICDHFGRYCAKNTVAVALSYFCLFLYLFLIVMSSIKSRQS
ncbi:CASP-like protein 1F2 [Impatiens glandulifera]|uniref:CASP-like protein 1F2 n=1 Tax=Impatiens glandulifera TaxID=253017 RepID=UPI001FB18814|nr:CASP-like protein 1F2 [Impatiens glandulifera]